MADVVGLTLLWQEAWGRAWPEEHRTLRVSSEDFHYSVLTRTVDIPAHLGYDVDEGPRTLGLPALVVLGEYAFVWDALVVQRERFFSEEPGTTVILTGHPGTGRTVMLIYLLLRRLEARLSTAYQCAPNEYILFHAGGVDVLKPDTRHPAMSSAWVLVDGNNGVGGLASAFDGAEQVLVGCSALRNRWKRWAGHGGVIRLVTALPKTPEIAAIAVHMGLEGGATRAVELADDWGPCIRTVLSIQANPEDEHGHFLDVSAAAHQLATDTTLIANTSLLSSQPNLSPLLFVRAVRRPDDGTPFNRKVKSVGQAFIPTCRLYVMLKLAMGAQASAGALHVFEQLSSHRSVRTSSGWAHERLMHAQFHGDEARSLEIEQAGGSTARIGPSAVLAPGLVEALHAIRPPFDFYWIPASDEFPGIDGVYCFDSNVYALQAMRPDDAVCPTQGLCQLWLAFDPDICLSLRFHFVAVAETDSSAVQLGHRFAAEVANVTPGGQPVSLWFGRLTRPT